MPALSIFILGIILLTMRTSIMATLPGWLGTPDLFFILLVFISVRFEILSGAILILLLGLAMDIFAGIFPGLHPLIYLLLFGLIQAINGRLFIKEKIYQIPLVMACYLLTNTACFIINLLLGLGNTLIWDWQAIVQQMLMLSILTIPFFILFDFFVNNQPLGQLTTMGKGRRGNRFRNT